MLTSSTDQWWAITYKYAAAELVEQTPKTTQQDQQAQESMHIFWK